MAITTTLATKLAEHTCRCSNSVAFGIEVAADVGEVAVPEDRVLDGCGLGQVGVTALLHSLDPRLRTGDEYVLLRGHEVPHALERIDLRTLQQFQ